MREDSSGECKKNRKKKQQTNERIVAGGNKTRQMSADLFVLQHAHLIATNLHKILTVSINSTKVHPTSIAFLMLKHAAQSPIYLDVCIAFDSNYSLVFSLPLSLCSLSLFPFVARVC